MDEPEVVFAHCKMWSSSSLHGFPKTIVGFWNIIETRDPPLAFWRQVDTLTFGDSTLFCEGATVITLFRLLTNVIGGWWLMSFRWRNKPNKFFQFLVCLRNEMPNTLFNIHPVSKSTVPKVKASIIAKLGTEGLSSLEISHEREMFLWILGEVSQCGAEWSCKRRCSRKRCKKAQSWLSCRCPVQRRQI